MSALTQGQEAAVRDGPCRAKRTSTFLTAAGHIQLGIAITVFSVALDVGTCPAAGDERTR